MAVAFRLRQGEISIQVEFAQPSFSLFSNALEIARALWSGLSPLGMKLPDLKIAAREPTYAEAHFTCFLYNIGAELTVRPERIEIRSVDPAKRSDAFTALNAAVAAAVQAAGDVALKSCTSITSIHGELLDHNIRDFIGHYVTSPPAATGSQFGAGVVFFYEPNDGRLVSSVTLEPSLNIQGGLYFRTLNIWGLQSLPVAVLAEHDAKAVSDVLTAFDLSLS